MNTSARERAIAPFHLTEPQRAAALERTRDVVVTAGAGCGKTSTLVARYVSLLADGCTPRSILAVTFTEKAAREMRSRVRRAVNTLSASAGDEDERQFWSSLYSSLDAARIGTIHSLCAEILRAHPAEANIDPRFNVLDEAQAALLRSQAVQDTLDELVDIAGCEVLFSAFSTQKLGKLLGTLLDQRLDASELRHTNVNPIQKFIQDAVDDPLLADGFRSLEAMSPGELERDAGDKLAPQVSMLLELERTARQALAANEPFQAVNALHKARREGMSLRVGRNGRCKEIIRELQARYDALLAPLIGGSTNDLPPQEQDEETFIQAQDALWQAYDLLLEKYTTALSQQQALDFDDLEQRAYNLLGQDEVRRRWQAEFAHVLVDEFQDTNRRQRGIIEALVSSPGHLFIVGDARQSIYRFRRADVTVFREVQARLASRGGLLVNLDTSFRTHAPLLTSAGELLAEVMGTQEQPERPYEVPFTPLIANRPAPEAYLRDPHIEFVLGAGDNAEEARPIAAQALAERLLELKAEGQIRAWDEVALLLRSSSGFSTYEDAFERAGIPYVTVAGRGMYDRPEIRDVLNMLSALADPTDDLAMAGLLRSPALGLSDGALYQLRWRGGVQTPYYESLQQDLSMLSSEDQCRAQRARAIYGSLQSVVDRVPIAELLQRLAMETDYRAILALDDRPGSGGRLWRNLDKLISDAQAGQQVLVRDFIDYIAQLDDVSAREGEAPSEALGSLRLMTIHRAKGLEFPVVVLADAARRPHNADNSCLLLPEYGLTFRLDKPTILTKLAERSNNLQDAAESNRLLYVALTRARDKLIISGHLTVNDHGQVSTAGWLQALCAAAGFTPELLAQEPGKPHVLATPAGHPVRMLVMNAAQEAKTSQAPAGWLPPEPDLVPLYAPLTSEPIPELVVADEPDESRPWQIASGPAEVPPVVLGTLVHKALELWLFPGDLRLRSLLEGTALSNGLVMPEQQQAAIEQAERLLGRLRNHPLYQQVASSTRHLHEVPYIRREGGRSEAGYIDLLYQADDTWHIVDFKTEAIGSASERSRRIEEHRPQMLRYASAASELLHAPVHVQVCFLDDCGEVSLVAYS